MLQNIVHEPSISLIVFHCFVHHQQHQLSYEPLANGPYTDTTQGPVYENLPPMDTTQRKHWSSFLPTQNKSASLPSSRRTSALNLNVMAPRPFVPFKDQPKDTEPKSIYSAQESLFSSSVPQSQTSPKYTGITNDSNSVVKATRVIIQPGSDSQGNSPRSPSMTYEPKPLVAGGSVNRTGLYNVKRTPHGRYMTISSSEPVKLETSYMQPATLHSSAGDLITNREVSFNAFLCG